MAERRREDRGFVAWVRQLVVVLTDAHAAASWPRDRSAKIRDYDRQFAKEEVNVQR